MSFVIPKKNTVWDWPGSTKAARMIFKLLNIKPLEMKGTDKEILRLRGEIRAGMLEVVAYRNDLNTFGLQIRTPGTYQDRGGALLHDCQHIVFVPESEGQSFVERRVEVLCRNGQVDVSGWGIHTTIDGMKESGAEA